MRFLKLLKFSVGVLELRVCAAFLAHSAMVQTGLWFPERIHVS